MAVSFFHTGHRQWANVGDGVHDVPLRCHSEPVTVSLAWESASSVSLYTREACSAAVPRWERIATLLCAAKQVPSLGVLLTMTEKGGMTRCRGGRLCPPEWITCRHGGASYPKGICSAALHCGTASTTSPCPGRSSPYDRKRPHRLVGAPSLCVCVRRERKSHQEE